MLLTEEFVGAQAPRSAAERQKCIAAQEKSLLSLAWDRSRYSQDLARAACRLLSVIAFSDHAEPVDLALLGDDAGSSGDAGSERGAKRSAAEVDAQPSKPAKKVKRSPTAVTNGSTAKALQRGDKVACLDQSLWVLGRVSRYLPDVKKYEILDDADGEEQVYRVFRRNIRQLPKKPMPLDPKKRVLAVYPMTTVFYPAMLRKRRGNNWIVEFDDEDDTEENKWKEVDGRLIIYEP